MDERRYLEAAKRADIPHARIKAFLNREEGLVGQEAYRMCLELGVSARELLRDEAGELLHKLGKISYRTINEIDEVSEIYTPLGRTTIYNTHSALMSIFAVAESHRSDYGNSEFIRFDCASGVTHAISYGSIERIDTSLDFEFPPEPQFHAEFQLAITPGVDSIGSTDPRTETIRKNRSALLKSMQRPIEDGVMEVRLSNGKVLKCPLTSEWGYDAAAQLVFDQLLAPDDDEMFLQVPLTPQYEEDHQFIRKSLIVSMTLPTEHLVRHEHPPHDEEELEYESV